MNYTKIYQSLMVRARGRTLTGYREVHHEIPVCLGGSDDPTNLVELTPEEHYLVHLILVKLHPTHRGLLYAAKMMAGQHNNKSYGWIRRKISETGFTEEHKRNLSIAHTKTLPEMQEIWKRNDLKRQLKKDAEVITALIYSI